MQPSRSARISGNRLLKIWNPVPMSGDITLSRSRTWHFSHTLYTSLRPEAARGLSPTSSIDPWDFIKHMFHDLFEQGPATVSYIHLRVSRQAFDHCVACGKSGSALPDLPFSGFIHGWTPSGLPSVLNCVPIHNTGKNSLSLPPRQLPRSCIFLFAGNLPPGSAEGEGKENSPRIQRRRRPTTLPPR